MCRGIEIEWRNGLSLPEKGGRLKQPPILHRALHLVFAAKLVDKNYL